MKQQILAVSLSGLLLISGCANGSSQPADPEGAPASSPAPSAAASDSGETASAQTSAPAENISEEEAKAIAFQDAGVNETDVAFIQVKRDIEKGKEVYDVEFLAGDKEYDYEIAVSNGEIVSFDTDMEAEAPSAGGSEAAISEEDAKKTALDHAGLKESDVTFREVRKDIEDGTEVYKIEFVSGQTEYEYEIRVSGGAITDFDSEPVND